MPLPVEDQAFEQVGPAQERAVGGGRASKHDVIAAAGADVATVDREFFAAQAAATRLLVDRLGDFDRLAPSRGGMDVDLDDAGIRRDPDDIHARIGGRLVTFQMDRGVELRRGRFDGGDELEIILQPFERRHEDANAALARLHRQRGAHGHARCGRGGDDRGRWAVAAARVARVDAVAAVGNGLGEELRIGQLLALAHRVGRHDVRIIEGTKSRQRAERQARADRRLPRYEKQASPRCLPDLADPTLAALRGPTLHRQHVAYRRCRLALFAHALGRIFECGLRVRAIKSEARCQRLSEPLRILRARSRSGALGRDARRVMPNRLAVASPIEAEGPPRHGLAGIPFARPVVQQSSGRKPLSQPADQVVGAHALGRTEGGGVPLHRLMVVDRNESRLTTHGEAHVVARKLAVDLFTQRVERRPCRVGQGIAHARLFRDARHLHLE